jgi:hypothetical protein
MGEAPLSRESRQKRPAFYAESHITFEIGAAVRKTHGLGMDEEGFAAHTFRGEWPLSSKVTTRRNAAP